MTLRSVLCACKRPAMLVTGKKIYPHRPDLENRRFWYCRPCGAWVGCHRNSSTFAPLGVLADEELRALKRRVHTLLDPMWKGGSMTRSEAYAWLAVHMGMESHRCHVGWFDQKQCRRAIAVLRASKTTGGVRK